ncbi:hypothetical protein K6Q96_06210 [Grimontia kaedaensis]|uniref:Calx-beta domain-containing protein n=1 Tax=Grimontia kaedaensis TaxID=2872157 RepID=A0ABY4WX62_9GAMM|nr:hypothetical protein [Grimontia kaedaensis]USH03588.1 hypothetical protein K6Q96_06210 [Grimontia kaedaensis]
MKKRLIAGFILASVISIGAKAECYGNVYAMNAGRGHVGFMIDLQETKKLSGTYNGDRAIKKSRAEFSTSAMAYDKNTNRIYYVSAPRPEAYYVEELGQDTSVDEFASLDFHASKLKPNQLAYFDSQTNTHTIVGNIPSVFRMAFEPATGTLYASDNRKLFTIDPSTASTTDIAEFDKPTLGYSGFSSWGDFVFYKGDLLFITNGRTFSINTSNAVAKLESFHFVDFITAATLDQNGQVLIAAKNQNVTGNINSTKLVRLNPETGEKVVVGLFPNRISAMATNTQESHECYDATIFPSERNIEVSDVSDDTVTEGQNATFYVSLNQKLKADKDVVLAIKDNTAKVNVDYSADVTIGYNGTTEDVTLNSEGVSVNFEPGDNIFSVVVPTVNDDNDEPAKTFTLDAWIKEDESDLKSGTGTINDNDEPSFNCNNSDKLYSYIRGSDIDAPFSGGIVMDCEKSTVQKYYMTSRTKGSISWKTELGGSQSVDAMSIGYIGQSEIKTLTNVNAYMTEFYKNYCQHGDTLGTRLSNTIYVTITADENGLPSCTTRLIGTYCLGEGTKSKTVDITRKGCKTSP